ncbi:hypothetical protein JCM19232_5031 [Vibrio ishigakensis]|uniref:Uncharacterized protein n=1 Tax=Vibrio ishigakensis TaxID=1481914 RepID=A0A0B8PN37_9VIBR|nr:hypothetical protein JCM19232_5031 [Vibrio ishigakensis]
MRIFIQADHLDTHIRKTVALWCDGKIYCIALATLTKNNRVAIFHCRAL